MYNNNLTWIQSIFWPSAPSSHRPEEGLLSRNIIGGLSQITVFEVLTNSKRYQAVAMNTAG